jgi:hypothetical protein
MLLELQRGEMMSAMRQEEIDKAQTELCRALRTAKDKLGDYDVIECFIAVLSEGDAHVKVSITYPRKKKT